MTSSASGATTGEDAVLPALAVGDQAGYVSAVSVLVLGLAFALLVLGDVVFVPRPVRHPWRFFFSRFSGQRPVSTMATPTPWPVRALRVQEIGADDRREVGGAHTGGARAIGGQDQGAAFTEDGLDEVAVGERFGIHRRT